MHYHLEKRSKRSWTIVIDMGRDPVTGKRKRKYIAVEGTKAKAEAEAQRIIGEMTVGVYVEPARITLGQWLVEFLEEKKADIAPRTYESYEMIIRRHLIPALGNIPLQELTPAHIAMYKTAKLKEVSPSTKKPLSPRTVAYHLTVLSEALKTAKKRKLIRENPAEDVDKPKYDPVKYYVYTEEEIEALLETTRKYRPSLYPIIFLALRTGLRLGEVLALRWRNVDLEKGVIYVQEKVERLKNQGIVFSRPKAHSVGAIPISQATVELLRSLQNGKKPDDLVFATSRGTPYDIKNVSAYFADIRRKAGLKEGRFHDLRHTHATYLLDEGVSLPTVQQRLRHKHLSTTADIYSHALAERQQPAVEKLEERFGRQLGDNSGGKSDGGNN